MSFSKSYLQKAMDVLARIDADAIEKAAETLAEVRAQEGRLFVIGSGGGAGHASHAACDFRKLCNIETYAPYDNVSELTARVNDDGWETTISNWLKVSRFGSADALLVLSVGGGNEEAKLSMNLVNAIKLAKQVGAKVIGIVGKNGGYTKQVGDAAIVIPDVDSSLVTPLAEGFQAVLWHLLASHPKLQVHVGKWESLTASVVALEQSFEPIAQP
jgi:D-sedoheptulose 7-phosphate isomerase